MGHVSLIRPLTEYWGDDYTRVVSDGGMTLTVAQPSLDELSEVVSTMAHWQDEGAPLQLHPGDLGWYWQFGGEKTVAAVRTWRREGELLAVGLLDGPDLIRIAMSPVANHDQELAGRMVADFTDPARGVLPAGPFHVEARVGVALQTLMEGHGWEPGEAWTPLRRVLDTPVEDSGLRIEVVSPGGEGKLTAVHHADHRGHGYGRAISIAAAAALQDMGASSAVVGTPSDNVGAVATYTSAGFVPDAQSLDRRWTAA